VGQVQDFHGSIFPLPALSGFGFVYYVRFSRIGRAIGAHTGAGEQCTDAVEAGVGAERPAHIHTGTGSGGLVWAKGGDGAAYIMPG